MAGDFVVIQFATARKIEVHRIAAALGVTRSHAFGLCVETWIWFDEQTEDGVAKGATCDMLDGIVGVPGFSKALSDVGWLRVRDSSLELPNFDRLMGKSAKKRINDALRKRNSRDAKTSEVDDSEEDSDDEQETRKPVVTASQKVVTHVTKRADENVTLQNRTEQYSDTDTDTGGEPERDETAECIPADWTDDHGDLSEDACETVEPLPIGKLDPSAVYASVTPDTLRNRTAVVSWFRRQLSASAPVLGPTRADLLLAVCASFKACEPGAKQPVGVFVNVIRGRRWKAVKRYRDRAEEIIKKELSRDLARSN